MSEGAAFGGANGAPWTSLYPAAVGAELETAHSDVLSLFEDCVASAAESTALYYFDAEVSYAQLDRDSDALAAWLLENGVKRADRVCVIAQNVPGFPVACIAAWKIAAVPVPVNPMYRHAELARILADAAPAAILCQDGEVSEVSIACELAGYAHLPIVIVSPADGQTLDSAVLPARVASNTAASLTEVLELMRGRRPPQVTVAPDELALILYTSGTTGLPKGAMLSHRALSFNAQFLQAWCGLGENSIILAIAPFFHITGLVCHICTMFAARCGIVINYRFEPQLVLDMIRRWRPTFTIGAITAFNALMRLPEIGPNDMASFEQVFSGGAPIPPTLRENIQDVLGVAIHPSYGMTETAAPAIFTPPGMSAPVRDGVLSIGVPNPSTSIRVANEAGDSVGIGEVGEILIRGPQVMQGYWRKADESAAALDGGWMHSGDIGFMDDAGWIYLVDRKKDVIIASGFKVWPREVEDILYSHPAVREAAVVGVPDDYRGETVKAIVSLKPEETVEPETLIEHCRSRLASYKVPRIVEVLDDLPKTVSGKIQRVALRPSA